MTTQAIQFSVDDVIGSYIMQNPDPSNGWHYGQITRGDGSNFKWTNRAGTSWTLIPDGRINTRLGTDKTNPYNTSAPNTAPNFDFELVAGNNEVHGFRFGPDGRYNKCPIKIPLKVDSSAAPNDFRPRATITGTAVNGSYDILFDTGSWTTHLPELAVDPEKRTVLNAQVTDKRGNECRLVKGQLAMMGTDKQLYTVDDFEFYEILATSQNQKPIMGAFPSPDPETKKPSFAYALAQKYSGAHKFGFGFVSELPPLTASDGGLNVGDGWKTSKLYLLLGADPVHTNDLNWRSDIPNWCDGLDFCPEAVPGFKIKVSFPGASPALAEIVSPDVKATIDTGAPDLTLRLGSGDPHLATSYAAYFTTNGADWWKNKVGYTTARSLEKATVTVVFTDSAGILKQYAFTAKGASKSPATLYAGTWDGDVPWKVQPCKDFPRDRISLGNTIYYYCSVVFYDIVNKRVGFRFR